MLAVLIITHLVINSAHRTKNMIIGHAGFGEMAYIMDIAPHSIEIDKLGIESGLNEHKTDCKKNLMVLKYNSKALEYS